MDSLIKDVRALLVSLTFYRLLLLIVFVAVFVTGYTLWENRQTLYNRASVIKITGDYELSVPTYKAKELLSTFVKTHPEVVFLGVIDADPIRNRRTPKYRVYGNYLVESIVGIALESGVTGVLPLYSYDETNNKAVLSVMSGEFTCSPATPGSGLLFAMPELVPHIAATCRVPIPPAYNEATGWIALHLSTWPPKGGLDNLKFDALNMAIAYYNIEISKKKDIKIIE